MDAGNLNDSFVCIVQCELDISAFPGGTLVTGDVIIVVTSSTLVSTHHQHENQSRYQ